MSRTALSSPMNFRPFHLPIPGHTAARHFTLLHYVFMGIAALAALFSTSPASASESPPRIFMIGDSTMADKGTAIPEWGWGMALGKFLVDPSMVKNHAKNGRSSKSFVDEGLWQEVRDELKPGDWVIIQFSHNDEKSAPALHTDPATTFRDYLRNYIAESRERGAFPVLATPVVRRRFDDDGNLVDTHGDYPDAIRAVAREQQVPLLELQRATAELLIATGPEESKKFFMWLEPGAYRNRPKGAKDDTHFVELGATKVAELAVQQIREQRLPLMHWLK
jgi:Lysophospholipase L1 and related esterases